MQIRRTLILKTLLMHQTCAKYLVFWKIFQQSLSKFSDMLYHSLPESDLKLYHVPNERPISVKLFMKITLVMAEMIAILLLDAFC